MARSNPWKQKPRHTRHTTLIVVEGDTEYAFIQYLKGLCGRNCGTRVTIENAHGGGGDSVLKKAIQLCPPYDACLCLYDTDRMPTVKGHINKAKRFGIIEIQSVPCIEALLLKILEKHVPEETAQCKRTMQRIVGENKLTTSVTFQQYFPLDLLEQRRSSIQALDQLFQYINPKG
ncbi:RloB domain-containing protein [Coraliomargarita sp. SDUM461003]|uniref:RloB domain-containing protein n=1 Tax=Thalassobacterium maritimum TaxID=3041265 RepID=A0ABU1AVU6_9BACT|nr:RloB domain-containing protein [Coraliomargarita sp. SDUM461003]MDQ8208271.1 RloB domain-containing protein [Coraliomargarita sp. SDUM461003]